MPSPPGGYRYYRDAELGPTYAAAMDELFQIYSDSIPRVIAWAADEFPRAADEPEAAHARALKAKALDLLRGLLPASSLSHMGIYASGQTYEQLILHLLAHPLPEARSYGTMILDEVRAVMPSFVSRVTRPDRGGEWIAYLEQRARAGRAMGRPARPARAGPRPRTRRPVGPAGARRRGRGRPPDGAPVRVEHHLRGDDPARARAAAPGRACPAPRRPGGARANRRHRPGRGFEALRYRFEIVADYGAFRDLQRHRMLTVQWQALTPDLGADVPEQVQRAGAGRATAARWSAPGSSTSDSSIPGWAAPLRTPCAWGTACASCSTSTPVRRCS